MKPKLARGQTRRLCRLVVAMRNPRRRSNALIPAPNLAVTTRKNLSTAISQKTPFLSLRAAAVNEGKATVCLGRRHREFCPHTLPFEGLSIFVRKQKIANSGAGRND